MSSCLKTRILFLLTQTLPPPAWPTTSTPEVVVSVIVVRDVDSTVKIGDMDVIERMDVVDLGAVEELAGVAYSPPVQP